MCLSESGRRFQLRQWYSAAKAAPAGEPAPGGMAMGGMSSAAHTGTLLVAALVASQLSWVVFRAVALLPAGRRSRALDGDLDQLPDLLAPADDNRDHIRGRLDATVTVVEYGDFECPWTSMANPTAAGLLAANTDVRYVWRHLPLTDIHAHAPAGGRSRRSRQRSGRLLGNARDAVDPSRGAHRGRSHRLRGSAGTRYTAVPRRLDAAPPRVARSPRCRNQPT